MFKRVVARRLRYSEIISCFVHLRRDPSRGVVSHQKFPSTNLLRYVLSNERGDLMESLRVDSGSLASSTIGRQVMNSPGRTTSVRKLVQLGRADSPIASELSGHDVKVVVRHFLAAIHTVVLKRENPQWLVGCQQRMGHVSRGFDDGRAFFVSQIQQSADVAACDDTALAHLELHRGHHGNRTFGLCDHWNVGSARQRFTDFTWLLPR